ncbi:MAG TPA: hypothetical protein DHW22_01970 [Planctomycetaceae bacterium]|nr:hypothetical protein [Planctomycetaceae bacterium]
MGAIVFQSTDGTKVAGISTLPKFTEIGTSGPTHIILITINCVLECQYRFHLNAPVHRSWKSLQRLRNKATNKVDAWLQIGTT